MKFPLLLVGLGLISLFPKVAVDLVDQLALVMPTGTIIRATSWLARYELLGVLLIAAGVGLLWKRYGQRPAKKLL